MQHFQWYNNSKVKKGKFTRLGGSSVKKRTTPYNGDQTQEWSLKLGTTLVKSDSYSNFSIKIIPSLSGCLWAGGIKQGRHLRGLGDVAPQGKRKKKKEKREKKRKRKRGTMINVKLLHIKCCFFQFFNSPVALKNKKKILCPPRKKLKWCPWH